MAEELCLTTDVELSSLLYPDFLAGERRFEPRDGKPDQPEGDPVASWWRKEKAWGEKCGAPLVT